MQIPTMMRAPVGEPTQDRRKAETPAPSSDEKSFDDMVKGGEPSVDDRTMRGGETPDLTDQGMPSAQTPAQARDMTMAAATTAIRQSFSLDVTPTDGATTATALQSDGEVVVPANGHNGSLLQPTILLARLRMPSYLRRMRGAGYRETPEPLGPRLRRLWMRRPCALGLCKTVKMARVFWWQPRPPSRKQQMRWRHRSDPLMFRQWEKTRHKGWTPKRHNRPVPPRMASIQPDVPCRVWRTGHPVR